MVQPTRPLPRPPASPQLVEEVLGRTGRPGQDEVVTDVDLSGADWSGATLDCVELTSCRANGLVAAGTRWQRPAWWDVEMVGCDLSTASFEEGGWHRVRLTGCRLTGAALTSCVLEDVEMVGCVLDLASFRFSTLRRVALRECRMLRADLANTRLEEVVLAGCVLDEADLSLTRITGLRDRHTRRPGLGLVIEGGSILGLRGVTSLRGSARRRRPRAGAGTAVVLQPGHRPGSARRRRRRHRVNAR
ncbi:pentapeptide repeat-containing protein [Acidipropionibacterium timonense]|uniref:pentapeptide repeat-containing protein n=1 Tax=Acidipropionibacterium timonense TaxID=2161818 RepID=UPI001436B29E|nr:pentapeptide repeat-containing protein [Acidipropionibacterium timonense]